MILYRYFAREIFFTMFAVAGIVLVISTGWRFSGYLNEAARGLLTQDILFLIIAYRLPGFLELIIPISFFLSIMLVYGRLYADSEMVVLEACGFSTRRLIFMTMVMSFGVMLVTATVTLWLKPSGEARVEDLFNEQRSLTEFDTLVPGRFQTLRSGKRVTYTEELDDANELQRVFINEFKTAGFLKAKDVVTVIAESGSSVIDEETGNRFLVLQNGKRYSGKPGTGDYQVIEYEEYGQLIQRDRQTRKSRRRSAISTVQLLEQDNPTTISEMQWRISIIFMVPIIGLVAIPLSRVNPRQGRYTRLVPGMLFCILYVISLSAARSAIEKGQIEPLPGLWWVHLFYIAAMLSLYQFDLIKRPFERLLQNFRRDGDTA